MPDTSEHVKRRGRPPSPPESVRGHRIVTFVTDNEFEHLTRLSEELNTPLSATVYKLLSKYLAEHDSSPS